MTAARFQMQQLHLMLPVKALRLAKSRLLLPDAERQAIAEWLLVHTLDVAMKCLPAERIVVLTPDDAVKARARRLGVMIQHDSAGDLNASLHLGLSELRGRHPDATVAILVADLPRLSHAALSGALLDVADSSVARHIADHHGTGTTFVALPPGSRLPMLFGPSSARRFTEVGSVPILNAPEEIRTDLDTPADLFHLTSISKEELCQATP